MTGAASGAGWSGFESPGCLSNPVFLSLYGTLIKYIKYKYVTFVTLVQLQLLQ